MELGSIIIEGVSRAFKTLYKVECDEKQVQIQKTRKEFEGDVTVIVYSLLSLSKKSPEQTANDLGEYLIKHYIEIVKKCTVIKGFLNLTISDSYYLDFLKEKAGNDAFGFIQADDYSECYMVEYSSPNTNKPLHLGHIRNNILGWSICMILEANGKKVIKTNLVNDRGIHICKSMLAWQKWGNGETPASSGKKGDHLVGDYYVKFDSKYKKQIKELIEQGKTDEEAAKTAPLIEEAQEMLCKWEAKDPEVIALWKKMNGWVYDGFNMTYERLGVKFDKIYFESDTYLLGRDTVLDGLNRNVFYPSEDNSIWVDLTDEGLDEKLLLRSDGTSVYMTQDIGTAQVRQQDYAPDKMVYVVGNEQNYHFKVLSLILEKLGFKWAKDLFHLSYGMVELPGGKMKSREGTVVDADDLIDEMIATARSMADELGKLEGLTEKEKENTYRIIGLGALKYFILKVDPTKNMIFIPKESIDFNGNTGPFIQYTYARICSVMRKAEELGIILNKDYSTDLCINEKEKSIVKLIHDLPEIIAESAKNLSPALIANYVFDLAKEYNQFYHEYPILKEENENKRNFRLHLSAIAGSVVQRAMELLGIEVPERM
jgi:arginyl-tRNA synthetase